MPARLLLCLAAASILSAQTHPESEKKAREAVAGLGKEIRALLSEELKKGGFPGAVAACSSAAQRITADFARRSGLAIRRISDRPRNPLDAPDGYEAGVLREWQSALQRGETLSESSAVKVESGQAMLRFMKPILVEGLCLSCHGQPGEIDPAVLRTIRSHYPADPATGYRAGGLRGAFSVRIPVPPQKPE